METRQGHKSFKVLAQAWDGSGWPSKTTGKQAWLTERVDMSRILGGAELPDKPENVPKFIMEI